jgi:hypothetical protein
MAVGTQLDVLEGRYNTAIAMAEGAQILGQRYERYLKTVTPLEREHELELLSWWFLKKKNLFRDNAFLFEELSAVNRRYLIYLVGKPLQHFYSRNRRTFAFGNVLGKSRQEVLASRAWGTYRVEDEFADKPARKRRP